MAGQGSGSASLEAVHGPAPAVRLLGPVAVAAGDGWRPINGLRRSAVLAALALQPGATVSAHRLVDIVWGDQAPRTAGEALRIHVSYLRGVLPAGAAIETRSAGYAINLGPPGTDVEATERLIALADRATDAGERAGRLRAAIALWQGSPLGDLAELDWFGEHAQRLHRRLLDARRRLIDSRLELGEHRQLVTELEDLSREYRLDEELSGQLMVALSRTGRPADALAAYQRLRHTLDEELGVLPGAALRDLHTAILREDPSVAPTRPEAVAADATPPARPLPAQLPPAIVAFAGRGREAASLHDALAGIPAGSGPVIVAICGTAGVGKTALAVHWAHRVKERFPDGQLYVDLRGFDPGGAVMDPAEAVRAFLDALGVPRRRVPASPQAQVSLYRSVLADKRMVIVADNARDEQQVRPLLPGASGCLVVVTSRNQLPGLVAVDAAHPLNLDRPPVDEAREILARRLGPQLIADEPDAVDDIIACCARLPLALAAAAALARTVPLTRLAAQLTDAATVLDAFDNADPASNIRAVFARSYDALTGPAARLFRLLGPCPGPDVTLPAAASTAGLTTRETRPLLAELTRAHLLTETSPGRFGFNDLLRAYAIEQADRRDTGEERAGARRRFLDHHLHTAYAATLLLRPGRAPISLAGPEPDVTPQILAGGDAALAWFAAERPVLLAVMARPPDGHDRHTWQLAWALHPFLTARADRRDNELVQLAGQHASRRLGEPDAQAHASLCLGTAYLRQGRLTEAEDLMRTALHLFELVGDSVAVTDTYLNLSMVAIRRDDIREALARAEHAHRYARLLGHRAGQAYAANNIGWCYGRLGDHRTGLAFCREALDVFSELGNLEAAADTWDSLGELRFGVGDPAQAEHCYRQAIALHRRRGNRLREADVHTNLGDGHDRAGNREAARRAWRQALTILDDLEPDAAVRIRGRLDPPSVLNPSTRGPAMTPADRRAGYHP